jgi:hypothetical protein
MLADHPRIVPIDEPQIGRHVAPFLSDEPGASVQDLDYSNFTFPRFAGEVPTYFLSERHSNVWVPALGDLLAKRLAVHGRSRALIAVKEPNGSQAADLILRALPQSKLLLLLRDGRDVVDSETAAFTQGSWMSRRYPTFRGFSPAERFEFVRQAAHKWAWRTDLVMDALEIHSGPKFTLRYEDLLSETETQLQDLFDWLGLRGVDAGKVAERHSFERADSGPEQFVRAAQPGLWRENLTENEQQLIVEIMGATLTRAGYE